MKNNLHKQKLMVTGANGFIGRSLLKRLVIENYDVRIVVRNELGINCNEAIEIIKFDELSPFYDWEKALKNVQTILHLASRVHVMKDAAKDPIHEYSLINVDSTLNLARQASKLGVRRFIYLSSVKVNGEHTIQGNPFFAHSLPSPQDPYSYSKFQAELGLKEIGAETGMEIVIIRPPLVYGPGVKANFLIIMNLLWHSVPMPLGSINNLRSLVAVDNLIDFLIKCINHPNAVNQTFLVSDGEDISTTNLLYKLGDKLGKPARLIKISSSKLEYMLKLVGRTSAASRLCSSLQVDISKSRKLLEWKPLISVDEGLSRVAEDFKRR